ncbi:MAG: hypothetical protein IPJ06_04000 [Saprospiraceae bacterium]|nr:hypothetical protein [Saprospiraceae bacterium]
MRISLVALLLGVFLSSVNLCAQVYIYGPTDVCGGCQTYTVDNQNSQLLTGWELNANGSFS